MCESQTGASPAEYAVDSETPDRPSLTSLIGRIAFAVDGVLPTGDVAELRRLDPRDPASPAFFKLMLSMVEPSLDLPPDGPTRDAVERRWAAVFQTTATLAGLHQPQRRLGDALAAAGYSELRLVRLLRAQPEMLPREVRTCSHFLAAKAEPSNLAELARLLVTTDPDKSGSLRRGIARAYYRHQAHDKKEN